MTYPKEDITAMRETLHISEWEGLVDRDLLATLWEGCVGWKNIPDKEVIEMYENIYGESDNYEEQLKDKQGRIIEKFKSVHLKGKNLVICDKKVKE